MPQALLWVLRVGYHAKTSWVAERCCNSPVERLTKAGCCAHCSLLGHCGLGTAVRPGESWGLGSDRRLDQVWHQALPRPACLHHNHSTAPECPSVSRQAYHDAPVFSESFFPWMWSSWPTGPTWFTSNELVAGAAIYRMTEPEAGVGGTCGSRVGGDGPCRPGCVTSPSMGEGHPDPPTPGTPCPSDVPQVHPSRPHPTHFESELLKAPPL